ncbi:hypothetical protein ACWT_3206 [Actinoplanes sp. SE50]|uniref:hypothetical protein n=1 Tax=unclassified Actinoplanes TaxID=2626549 RepID=UPI00023EC955|nr:MULTISPECIES: hypothetical protein [unclassified Actinoplanes]AEV84229.1 hypothetical protein ACPL_3334 [Actinoplanes sp. SE50/110]ATO82621.1 hypothetical protein ACWT_3206 [Actinoplanes sp. SE50]SLM00028.1 hypothetical protein ACSP50_3260 [Actinoplanes sp. SE50/110]
MSIIVKRLDRAASGPREPRPVKMAVCGIGTVVLAATVALAAAVPGEWVTSTGARHQWNYPLVMWPLLLALIVAGLVMTASWRWARPAAVAAVIVAAQVAGYGLVSVRSWFDLAATARVDGLDQENLPTVVTLAAVVMAAAAAAAVLAAAAAWQEPARGRSGLAPKRPGYLAVGAAVVTLPSLAATIMTVPDFVSAGWETSLTCLLPWGASIAAIAWLRGRSATTAGVTVVASAVLVVASTIAMHRTGHMYPPTSD